MLKKLELIEGIDEKYHEMLKKVDIANFTKCVAAFGDMDIREVSDEAIKDYLWKWAVNKYRFYELLNKNLYIDYDIEYKEFDNEESRLRKYDELEQEYPLFAPWLHLVKYEKTQKIGEGSYASNNRFMLGEIVHTIDDHIQYQGTTIGRLFKKMGLPDDLITKVGRIYENKKVKGKYTISIDPVDMMLASENPYNWKSCYRLDGDHGDGTLASVIDTSSVISYIWTKEGNFKLDNGLEMKKVRFKQQRQTLSISPKMRNVHFNKVYPAKDSFPEKLAAMLRDKIENLIANYLGLNNIWVRNDYHTDTICFREYYYGYGEYNLENIYQLKDNDGNVLDEFWRPFDEFIICPCGCGTELPASDDEEWSHEGSGFRCDAYERDGYWCDYAEDYCEYEQDSMDCGDCNCRYYREHHCHCHVDTDKICPMPDLAKCTYEEELDGELMDGTSDNCKNCYMTQKRRTYTLKNPVGIKGIYVHHTEV